MNAKKVINFIGLSGPCVALSALLVIASWGMVFFGEKGLNLGIDFAGGTEALVSFSEKIDGVVSEEELSQAAEEVGLADAEIVTFQEAEPTGRRSFFLRSKSQASLFSDQYEALRSAIDFELGAATLSWEGELFSVFGPLEGALGRALKALPEGERESGFAAALRAGLKSLSAAGVSVSAEGERFKATGEGAQEKVTRTFGAARVDRWDTSDEGGERIRIRLFGRDNGGAIKKAVAGLKIAGSRVSQENETRNPVYAISADDGLRLKATMSALLKRKGLDEAAANDVQILRLEKVGATAGRQLRNQGILSVLYALLFVLAYIALRFDFRYSPGAIVALFHDVSITIGIFVITQYEFNLPIIAALLAIVGYSLNDTIVVYDRIRENLDTGRGSSLIETINMSVRDCLSRTVLTSVTTFIAVLAIFVWGGGIIKNFAFAMMVGVIVGTYSSIFIASPIVVAMDRYLEERKRRNAEIDRVLQS